jgi:hypothetical protein
MQKKVDKIATILNRATVLAMIALAVMTMGGG